jgi:predicted nucleic acid-binding protein
MARRMKSLTFDTGALIALERGDKRMRTIVKTARISGAVLIVPAPVVIEWWRGTRRHRHLQSSILEAVHVEPTTAELAKLAGEAIEATRGATPIDALVMASAAQREDLVYTSDFDDLDRLRSFFPNVRVLRV